MPKNQNSSPNHNQEKSKQGLSNEQRRRHDEQKFGEQPQQHGKSSGSTDRSAAGTRQGNQTQRSPMEDQDDLDRARDDERNNDDNRIEGKSIPGRRKDQSGSADNDQE